MADTKQGDGRLKRAVVEAGVDLAVRAAAMAVAPVGLVLGPGVKLMAALLDRHVADTRSERAAMLADAILRAGLTHEEFDSLGPEASETVFQTFRRTMDANDPAVIPTLGKLAAMAIKTGRDRFFISAGRMLEQMTAEEHAQLQSLATTLSGFGVGQGQVEIGFRKEGDPQGQFVARNRDLCVPVNVDYEVLRFLTLHSLAYQSSDDERVHTWERPTYIASLDPEIIGKLAQLFE